VCCHNGNSPKYDHCEQPGACGPTEIELSCAGPGDCSNGKGCCGHWNGSYWTGSDCSNQCASNWFCGGAPSSCPMGYSCFSDNELGAGYGWCGM